MYFYHNVDDSVLLDLLAKHTNRLTQIMIYGEMYAGEYRACKKMLELLQKEITSRNGSFPASARSLPPYASTSSAA